MERTSGREEGGGGGVGEVGGGGSQPNKELFIVTDYFLGDSS